MFSLVFSVRTFENALIFSGILLVFCAWAYYLCKKKSPLSFVFPLIVQAVAFLICIRTIGINHDESEHLHCAWLMGQGMVPFRDFWQHHSPLLWVVLAPFMKVFKPSVAIFEVSRLFSLAIFACSVFLGWKIARKAWGQKAQVASYLLMVSSITIYGEYYRLRPDIFMTFFLLVGVYATLAIPQGGVSAVFVAGASMALAQSFVSKQYLLVLLPVVALCIFKKRTGVFRGLFVYALGIAIGCAPLLWYLLQNGILKDCLYWVVMFNRERINFGTVFPLAVCLAGVLGAVRLFGAYRQDKNPQALIMVLAFWLSTASSFTGMISGSERISFREGYYQQFWLLLCAVAVSGGVILELVNTQTRLYRRAAVAGSIVTLLVAGNMFYAIPERKEFAKDKKAVAQLIAYSGGDTCLMLLPIHPIFCHDATRIYSYWQYVFCGVYPAVRDDTKAKNVAGAMLAQPPAVVLAELDKRDFMLDLFLRGLIAKVDYQPLKALFEEKYTVKVIGSGKYYIRNDRL